MSHTAHPNWFEKEVRMRSHAVWEHEGRMDGRADDNWARAAKEIDDECRSAAAGTNAHFTPPHLIISKLPTRH
jgi:hypothetical protein